MSAHFAKQKELVLFYDWIMIISLVREQLKGIPDDSNVALSIFGYSGIVTAGQVLQVIEGRPNDDYVQLSRSDDNPKIRACRLGELGKFFC
jgi:hypothetical protein